MPSLTPVTRRELVRKLKTLGFEGPFPGGKHGWMRREGLHVTIPNPHAGAIDPGRFGVSCVWRKLRLRNG